MKNKIHKILLIGLLIISHSFSQKKGLIKGKITNSQTGLPLIGANVQLLGTDLGTTTNDKGNFSLDQIMEGRYKIRVAYIGFQTFVVPDVLVRPNAYDFIDVKLEESILSMDNIVVQQSYFKKSIIKEFQTVSFDNEEIRRAPGSGQEISRILNSLPSVASVGENRQDMMVRGGGPTENGFIIDNIPIPSISHFNQVDGRSNGPIGLINTEMISNLDFYSNGFSSKFGNKLSSYGEIEYRDGNKDTFEGNLNLGMGGLGYLIEGPIGGGSSLIASFRKSYLDIIADAINAGGLPSYDDYQLKLSYEINNRNKVTFLIIKGSSLYDRSQNDALNDGESSYGKVSNNQNSYGINWRKLWSKNGFSNTSLSFSNQLSNISFNDIDTDTNNIYNNNHFKYLTFRNTNDYKSSDILSFQYGLESFVTKKDYNFDINNINIDLNKGMSGLAAYLTAKIIYKNNYILSFGIRNDQNSHDYINLLSPRLNFEYLLSSENSIIFNYGIYYQDAPGLYMTLENSESITSIKSVQTSVTYEKIFSPSTKLSLSIYSKEYSSAPILAKDNIYDDPTFLLDELRVYNGIQSNGNAKSSGLEFILQKKRAENLYGIVGWSLFSSTFLDYNGIKRSRNYDYNYIFNIVGGYKPKHDWEISFRWSYFGGKPITPINRELSILYNEQVLDNQNFNEESTPDYHSLFIRYEKRYSLTKFNIITFFELWNAYNRKNTEYYFWSNSKKNIQNVTYFSIIPIGGFELEF